MAKLKPVLANDLENLELYISNSNSVIIITDTKLASQIKQKVKADNRNGNSVHILKGVGLVALGVAIAPIGGTFMTIAAGVSVLTGLVSGTKQIWKRLNVKLQEYTWSEAELPNKIKLLILMKNRGFNKVKPDDEIDQEELRKITKVLEEMDK